MERTFGEGLVVAAKSFADEEITFFPGNLLFVSLVSGSEQEDVLESLLDTYAGTVIFEAEYMLGQQADVPGQDGSAPDEKCNSRNHNSVDYVRYC